MRKFKKTLSFLLALAMALTLIPALPMMANAGDAPTISVGSADIAYAAEGAERNVSLPVTIENPPDVLYYDYSFGVIYDNTKFTLTGVRAGELAYSLGSQVTGTPSVSDDPDGGVEGTLFYLDFAVVTNASAGEYPISVNLYGNSPYSFTDDEGTPITGVQFEAGSITVGEQPLTISAGSGSIAYEAEGEARNVTLPIIVEANSGFDHCELIVEYSDAYLTATAIRRGGLTSGLSDDAFQSNVDSYASIQGALVEINPDTPITESGTLCYVDFIVDEGAAWGNYSVSLKLTDESNLTNGESPISDVMLASGAVTVQVPISPRRADGVAASSAATISLGYSYNPGITSKFIDPAGQTLNYSYQLDGGAWTDVPASNGAYIGPQFFELIPASAGVFTYTFRAYNGTKYSIDYYTLVLTVQDPAVTNYQMTIKVAPSNLKIRLYHTTGFDAQGHDIYNESEPVTLPEGTIVSNYNQYEVSLLGGTYSYRGYYLDGDSNEVSVGGSSFDVPWISGAETTITLKQANFNANSKVNNAYPAESEVEFTAYAARPAEPPRAATFGPFWQDTSGSKRSTLLVCSVNNSPLYTYIAKPLGAFTTTYADYFSGNPATFSAATTVQTINTAFTAAKNYSIKVPDDATAKVFRQIVNYSVQEIPQSTPPTDNGDGTKTFHFRGATSNVTFRVTKPGYITKAAWIAPTEGSLYEVAWSGTEQAPESTQNIGDAVIGSGIGATVANVAENSMMSNVSVQNFKSMRMGDYFRLRLYRAAWQIIDTATNNQMIEPDFHYQVLQGADVLNISTVTSGNGNASGNWLDITPAQNGTAIIEAKYDGIDVLNLKSGVAWGTYGASDPYRTQLMVFTVGNGGDVINFDIQDRDSGHAWDCDFDTVFYTGDAGEISFKANATSPITEVAASNDKGATWTVLTDTDGLYTADVISGNNLLRVKTATTVGYQVVRAKRVVAKIKNASSSDPNTPIRPGDTVTLDFEGLYQPIPKFSGIYNPGFGNTMGISYTLPPYARFIGSTQVQYFFASAHTQVFSFDQPGSYTLTNGFANFTGMSSQYPYGQHRTLTDFGVGANFSAVNVPHQRDIFPDLTFEVEDGITGTFNVTGGGGHHTIVVKGTDGSIISPKEISTPNVYSFGGGIPAVYEISEPGYATKRGMLLYNYDTDSLTQSIDVQMMPINAATWDGTTQTEPTLVNGFYQITTGAELAWFGAQVTAGNQAINAKLINDIDLGGFNWTPIGGAVSPKTFNGVFNGNHKTVKNLYIRTAARTTTTPESCAFIASLGNGSVVRDLTTEGLLMTLPSDLVKGAASIFGGIVASNSNVTAQILGCTSKVDIAGFLVSDHTNSVAVYMGGIVGVGSGSSLIDGCANYGNIANTSVTDIYDTASGHGGIVGWQHSNGAIRNCVNFGDVLAPYGAGGLIGRSSQVPLLGNSYSLGTAIVTKTTDSSGALIGNFRGTSTVNRFTNLYYLEGKSAYGSGTNQAVQTNVTAKALADMQTADFTNQLNASLNGLYLNIETPSDYHFVQNADGFPLPALYKNVISAANVGSDLKVTVQIGSELLQNAEGSFTLIAAVHDKTTNKLLVLCETEVTGTIPDEVIVTIPNMTFDSATQSIKVFSWKTLEDIKPLTDAKTI